MHFGRTVIYPECTHLAEYLLDHGMLDRVTSRTALKDELVTIIRLLMKQPPAVKGDLPAPDTAEIPLQPKPVEGATA